MRTDRQGPQERVDRELRLLLQRWCPRTTPEPQEVAGMVALFTGAFDALSDCLSACGLPRSLALDDPRIPPHLAAASHDLGQLDSAVGDLVERVGARQGPTPRPFENVGTRCPVGREACWAVAGFLVTLIGPSTSPAPLASWLRETAQGLRAQATHCTTAYGGPR